MSCRILTAIVPILLILSSLARGETGSRTTCSLLGDDFKYVVDNFQMDMVDIVTSPLHIADENSVFRSPRFYLTLLGVGAVWGGSYALDQTMRSHLHGMSSSDADLLQNIG